MNIKSKFGYLCCAFLLTTSLWAQDVLISTRNTSLLLDAPVGGEVRFIYYGDKLSTSDAATLLETEQKTFSAYPVYGLNCPSESALSVTHGDGNMTLQLEVIKVDTRKEQTADITTIRLKDKVYPFYMNLCYRTYPDADIIETWTEITHEEKKAITLNRFASAYLPIRKGDVWVSHLYGSWANEAQLAQEPLRPGIKMIKNKDGIRNSHTAHAEVMISLDGKPKENTGSVIGAALCYSGNYKLFFDTDDSDYHHFFAGINEENSAYTLKAKESFRTPELALTYSKDGLSGSSRNFHAWARKHKIANGATARKILLNSWEGVYFDINQEGMDQMMSDIQSMGGELFVMDDGWFGARHSDRAGLGDWVVNPEKFPNGLEELIDRVHALGMDFGLWVEPESVNPDSDLYRAHPDWIHRLDGREPLTQRNQYLLDFGKPEVERFALDMLRGLLNTYAIRYLKWDMNRAMTDVCESLTPFARERHVLALYRILDALEKEFPDVDIEACSGGGARVDLGMAKRTAQFWVSDNTDPFDRLFIQEGYTLMYAPMMMSCWVTDTPADGRRRGRADWRYKFHAAMCGTLGVGADISKLSDEEMALFTAEIALYKMWRHVVQNGDLYRLQRPSGGNVAATEYVSKDQNEAVLFLFMHSRKCGEVIPRVRLRALREDARYFCVETGKTYAGRTLMHLGLSAELNGDFDSGVFYFQAVTEG